MCGSTPRQQTSLATAIHRQASDWRLGALDRAQQAAFEATRSPVPSPPVPLPREAWPLIRALGRDGRANAAELARATGRNHATVRRQLARLLATGALALRCEVAQDESLWPLHCTWLARVPEPEKERTLTALATLPELRLCVSTTAAGPPGKSWCRPRSTPAAADGGQGGQAGRRRVSSGMATVLGAGSSATS